MKSPPFSCYLSFIKNNEIFIRVGQTHEYIDIVYLHAINFISPSNLFDVVYEIKNKYGCFYNIKYIYVYVGFESLQYTCKALYYTCAYAPKEEFSVIYRNKLDDPL